MDGGADSAEGRIYAAASDRAAVPQYGFDQSGRPGLGDVLVLSAAQGLGEDLRYLLAWLNCALVAGWYRVKGRPLASRRHGRSAISAIPYRPIDRSRTAEVRIHDEIVRLVGEMIATKPGEDRTAGERQINQLIARLLSPGRTR